MGPMGFHKCFCCRRELVDNKSFSHGKKFCSGCDVVREKNKELFDLMLSAIRAHTDEAMKKHIIDSYHPVKRDH